MNRIRIGNDFAVRWRVFVNNGDIQLTSFNKDFMSLTAIDRYGTRRAINKFSIDGNLVTFRVYGHQMTGCNPWKTGRYRLELTVNKNDVGQAIVDACNAFELVGNSCDAGGDSQDVETSVVIDLESSELSYPYVASPFVIDDDGVLTNLKNGKKYKLSPVSEGEDVPGDDPAPTDSVKCYIGEVSASKSSFPTLSDDELISNSAQVDVSGTLVSSVTAKHSCIYFIVPESVQIKSVSYVSGGITTSITGNNLWNILHDDIIIDNVRHYVYGYRMAVVSESSPQTYDYELKLV